MNQLNLEARRHESRVLAAWAKSRPGSAERIADVSVGGVRNATTVLSSDADGMRELFQPITAASGFAVTDRTAMCVSTVYACLTVLANGVLQLPVYHYKYDGSGERAKVLDSNIYWLLNEQPTDAWTAASWKAWIVKCIALRGDQYTEIVRGTNRSGGVILGFDPLHPDLVVPRRVKKRLVYDVVDLLTGAVRTIDQDDMLHFAGFGFDGLRSMSAIQYAAKQAIGNSLASADYSGRTIGEGAMPQIALEFKDKLTKDQAQLLRDSFIATYGGTGSRKLPLVLTEGGKATELNISPVDLQLIESRRYEKEDICQALGVPPVLIGENDKTSSWGTGIEQITLGFVKFTLKPMLVRWEQEINRKCFRRSGQFIEHDLDGLLRGDSKAQAEAFKSALGGPGTGDGHMTINEVRRIKNLPRIAGGDEVYKAQRGTTATQPKAE